MRLGPGCLQLLAFLVVFINLSLQYDKVAIRRQSRKVPRSLKEGQRATLHRQRRAWIIDTFELEEEHPGPYPLLIGTVNVENGFQVRYKLTGIGVTEEPKGLFNINEDDGNIYVHRKIDYEQFSIFRWEFNAINRTSLEVGTRLGIHLKIIDINDNAPKFDAKSFDISVNESAVQGVSFFSLIARDRDEPSTSNSEVRYSILSHSPSDANVEFTIDSEKGFLSFKGCLDYETTKHYKLVVQARDNGKTVQQSSTCELHVSVIDGNDNIPVWKEGQFQGSVPERESNVTIVRFAVTDQDTPHTSAWRAVYTIDKGNERGNYKIQTDPQTNDGLLTVIKPLDFESGPTNKLSISLANEEPFFMCKVVKQSTNGLWIVDTGKTQARKLQEGLTRSVMVKVLDINDPPELHPPKISIYMEETETSGMKLGVLNATDPDTSFPNTIRYSVFKDPAGWISVDEHSGVITSKAALDRESPYVVNSSYTAILLAVDDGVPPMTSTATLVINLKDVNDNTPRLIQPNVTLCAGQDESILTLPVEDKDINPYSGPFHFELLEKAHLKGQLALRASHGDDLEVLQLKNIRRGNYTLQFQISDRQGMTSLQNLTVHVCECTQEGVCAKWVAGPPSLGGGAIALLLLALLLCCVGCLLLCKVDTETVMVPFDQEPLNTMVIYNEEGGNKDCDAYMKEEIDGEFHRASTKRYTAVESNQAVGAGNVNGGRTYSSQIQSISQQHLEASHFDRASKRRHSSYHIKEQQRARQHERRLTTSHSIATTPHRMTLVRNMSVNGHRAHTLAVSGTRRTSLTTSSSMTDYKMKTLETYLKQTLQNSTSNENDKEMYKPHVFADEGELSRASSLETISIEGSNFNLDRLHFLGSKFNILENICAQGIELNTHSDYEVTRKLTSSLST
ncbi:cadherin-like protein 26 isoform X1 [Ambystoma mexicanum]|uniref:cadherin-like protein 26 isoform X1 n=1 Tax=Ambystoma mexicanum TaxID=8296 RepID=UPI0037E70F3C